MKKNIIWVGIVSLLVLLVLQLANGYKSGGGLERIGRTFISRDLLAH